MHKSKTSRSDRQFASWLNTILQVVFDDDGMKVNTQDSTRIVPYDEMELLIETPRLYLLTYGGRATLLQKKDLTGDTQAFVGFLSAHALNVYQTENR